MRQAVTDAENVLCPPQLNGKRKISCPKHDKTLINHHKLRLYFSASNIIHQHTTNFFYYFLIVNYLE